MLRSRPFPWLVLLATSLACADAEPAMPTTAPAQAMNMPMQEPPAAASPPAVDLVDDVSAMLPKLDASLVAAATSPATKPLRADWPSFGGDPDNTRSSPAELAISTSNVANLAVAFAIEAPGVTSTAAAYGGVLHWTDWGGGVHATRLSDHSAVWEHNSAAMGGGYIGSPAVTERAVFVANRNGKVTAHDRQTGEVRWESVLDAGPHTYIWSSPVVAEADGVLVIGISSRGTTDNAEVVDEAKLRTFRGAVVGIATDSGKIMWRLETSPEPSGAGVGVWSSAALDLPNHLAFIGTGNNFYKPVSPLSDSLLAIDYLTGQLTWHAQYTKNDAWTAGSVSNEGTNSDVAAAPNLFLQDTRALVGVGDKAGVYHVHDRITGELIWQRALPFGGGFKGGIIAPAAFQNNTIYVASNKSEQGFVLALRASDGGELWRRQLPSNCWGGPAIGNGVLYVATNGGELFALDAESGEIRWQACLPLGTGGGFSLACGALFIGQGFHDFETSKEPLRGSLQAYTLGGKSVLCPDTRE